MRKWVKYTLIVFLLFPLVVLAVWYVSSFLVNLNEINSFATKGEEIVKTTNPIFYKLAVAAESKSAIRRFAMRNAYFWIVDNKHRSKMIWWHLNNILWYYASYLHFSDKDVFAIWVECSISMCSKGLNDASNKYFSKNLNQLSEKELAQLIVAVRSPSRYAPGSALGNERASLLLKAVKTHNNALNSQPSAAGSPKDGAHERNVISNKLEANMKVFWNDQGRGVESSNPVEVDLDKANLIWSDEVRGVEGNFYGLVDESGKTIQFYFFDGIPDYVDDARHLEIVEVDFPCPEEGGSYVKRIKIGDVYGYIEKAFKIGADPKHYDVEFRSW